MQNSFNLRIIDVNMMRERQQKIISHVEKFGIASYGELGKMFSVSPFTIRRDVDYLARSRLLVKVKGGAQRIETPSQFRETHLPQRMQVNLRQKEYIAEKALAFMEEGDSVFFDGSSTIACLARLLARAGRKITVVTNSILIALELSQAPDVRVVGLGGILDAETLSFVGFDADSHSDSFYIDKAFFSCTGLIPREGTFENALFNRNTKRFIAQRANKVYLLIDSSKLGRPALNHVLNTEDIDVLITEKPVSGKWQGVLAAKGVEIYY